MWLHLATNGRRIVFVPAVLGYYYILPARCRRDRQKLEIVQARILRIFNQVKVREFMKYEYFPYTLPPRHRVHLIETLSCLIGVRSPWVLVGGAGMGAASMRIPPAGGQWAN